MSANTFIRHQEIRYVLFDYDSGSLLDGVQHLTVDVFTDQPAESYCRLRDYLTYTEGLRFADSGEFESCRDDRFGECFVADATWHGKLFGVMFAAEG